MKQKLELTPREAAQRLEIGLDCIYAALWAGKLEGRRIEGRWLIPAQAVERRLQAKEARRGTPSR